MRKSTGLFSFSRLLALMATFLKKYIFGYALGQRVYRILSLYRFSFGQGGEQKPTNQQTNTHIRANIEISPTSCSPDMDLMNNNHRSLT